VKSFNIPETDEQAIAHTNLVAECWPNSGLDDPVRELGEREFSTWLIIRKSNQKLIEAIDDLEKLTIECRDALDKHEADEAQRAALATSNKISDDAKGRDWIAIWAAWAGSAIATVFGILGYVSGRDAQEEVRQNKHEIVERIGNAEGAEKARDGELRNLLEDHVRKFLIPNTEDNLPSDPNLPPPRTNPPPASQPSNPNPPENLDK
jgi:hypothetical protein